MPLEWTHDWTKCPKQATTCPGDKCCPEFPTPADRIAMARAAYEEWSEGTGDPLEDFVQDVEMLARAEGLEQKVWVVLEHEPDCTEPITVRAIFSAKAGAWDFWDMLKRANYGAKGYSPIGLWWTIQERIVQGPGADLEKLL